MSQKEIEIQGIVCPGCGEELNSTESIMKHLQLLHEASVFFARVLIAKDNITAKNYKKNK